MPKECYFPFRPLFLQVFWSSRKNCRPRGSETNWAESVVTWSKNSLFKWCLCFSFLLRRNKLAAGASMKKEHLGKTVLCKFCCEVDEQSEPVIIVIEAQYPILLCNKEGLWLCLDPSVLGGRKSIISWFLLLRMAALNGVTVGILSCMFGYKYFLFVEISRVRPCCTRPKVAVLFWSLPLSLG